MSEETKAPEKTFTQAELDAIVGERLSRERTKYEGFDELKAKAAKYDEMEEASKSELQKAVERGNELQSRLDAMEQAEKLRLMREAVSQATGVPANILSGLTEEECQEQAKAILEFSKPSGYPQVRDGGELAKVGKPSTREQFAEWFNSQV